jgi:hypothetical protein
MEWASLMGHQLRQLDQYSWVSQLSIVVDGSIQGRPNAFGALGEILALALFFF